MPGISSKMLTERLRTLQEPSVPPKVTYSLTKEGRELTAVLDQLNTLAYRWQETPSGQIQEKAG
jgi:DNA-binding HxlR family transcriptional regulator